MLSPFGKTLNESALDKFMMRVKVGWFTTFSGLSKATLSFGYYFFVFEMRAFLTVYSSSFSSDPIFVVAIPSICAFEFF